MTELLFESMIGSCKNGKMGVIFFTPHPAQIIHHSRVIAGDACRYLHALPTPTTSVDTEIHANARRSRPEEWYTEQTEARDEKRYRRASDVSPRQHSPRVPSFANNDSDVHSQIRPQRSTYETTSQYDPGQPSLLRESGGSVALQQDQNAPYQRTDSSGHRAPASHTTAPAPSNGTEVNSRLIWDPVTKSLVSEKSLQTPELSGPAHNADRHYTAVSHASRSPLGGTGKLHDNSRHGTSRNEAERDRSNRAHVRQLTPPIHPQATSAVSSAPTSASKSSLPIPALKPAHVAKSAKEAADQHRVKLKAQLHRANMEAARSANQKSADEIPVKVAPPPPDRHDSGDPQHHITYEVRLDIPSSASPNSQYMRTLIFGKDSTNIIRVADLSKARIRISTSHNCLVISGTREQTDTAVMLLEQSVQTRFDGWRAKIVKQYPEHHAEHQRAETAPHHVPLHHNTPSLTLLGRNGVSTGELAPTASQHVPKSSDKQSPHAHTRALDTTSPPMNSFGRPHAPNLQPADEMKVSTVPATQGLRERTSADAQVWLQEVARSFGHEPASAAQMSPPKASSSYVRVKEEEDSPSMSDLSPQLIQGKEQTDNAEQVLRAKLRERNTASKKISDVIEPDVGHATATIPQESAVNSEGKPYVSVQTLQ